MRRGRPYAARILPASRAEAVAHRGAYLGRRVEGADHRPLRGRVLRREQPEVARKLETVRKGEVADDQVVVPLADIAAAHPDLAARRLDPVVQRPAGEVPTRAPLHRHRIAL